MQNYIKSKFNLFKLQKKHNYALVNDKFKKILEHKKFRGKLIPIQYKQYIKIKYKIKNTYLKSKANNENTCFCFYFVKKIKN